MKVPDLTLLFITVVTSVMFVLFMREKGLPDLEKFEADTRRFSEMAQVGHYLDAHIQEQDFVMASDVLNDLMPGVSSKAKVITFRTGDFFSMSLFPVSEIEQRIADRQVVFSETASPQAKMEVLQKYDIGFIVLVGADRDLFADLLATYPSLTKMEKVNRYYVVEIKDE